MFMRIFCLLTLFISLNDLDLAKASELNGLNAEEKLSVLGLLAKEDYDRFTELTRELFRIIRKRGVSPGEDREDLNAVESVLRKTLDSWRTYDASQFKVVSQITDFNKSEYSQEHETKRIGIIVVMMGVMASLAERPKLIIPSLILMGVGSIVVYIAPLLLRNSSARALASALNAQIEKHKVEFETRLEQIIEIYSLLANQPDSTLETDYPWVEEMAEKLNPS